MVKVTNTTMCGKSCESIVHRFGSVSKYLFELRWLNDEDPTWYIVLKFPSDLLDCHRYCTHEEAQCSALNCISNLQYRMKEKKMNAEEKMQKVVELIGVVKSMQEETNERATRLEKDAAATTEKVTREMTSLRELVSSSSSSSSLDATVFSEIRDEMKKMREATEAFGRRLEKVEEELEELRNANAENVGGGGFEEDAHSKRKNRNRTQQQQHSIDDRRRRLDDMYKKLEELN